MINQDFNSILDLIKAFPNEQTCIDHLELLRWNGVVVSPFDSSSKVYDCKGNKYKCKNTGKYFNVKTSTLFDNTKIELQKWFLAIWLVTSHKKGISYHLGNIFREGELAENSVVKEILTTANDGKNYPTNFYNLDAIIAVGYRVSCEEIYARWDSV